MQTFSIIGFLLNVLGGLGIFLYGLKIMSRTLQKVSADKLKLFFEKITKNKLMGIFFGGIVTSILQSSSATTVIMIGFANAGVIGLAQCISIVMGANIGTTITAQIIAFKYSHIALPIIGIGASFTLFSKSKRWQSIGEIFLGLGLLFYGLKILGSFLKPLEEIAVFKELLVTFGQNPILGLFVGMLFTFIFQSSSATTGMIIILAGLGLLNFTSAFSLELGCNIGTTITAQIAAIGTNQTSKRVAWAHTMFNVIGATYMLLLFNIKVGGLPIFLKFIDIITPGNVLIGENIERHIANAHTFFNVFNVLILFPFINLLAKLTMIIIPPGKEKPLVFESHLDKRMTSSPPIALQQATKETIRMGFVAKEMSRFSYQYIFKNKANAHNDILEYEDILNKSQKEIIDFIIEIDRNLFTKKEAPYSNMLIQLVRHFERIGDNFTAMSTATETFRDEKHLLNQESQEFIKQMHYNVQNMFQKTLTALRTENKKELKKMHTFEKENTKLESAYREKQIEKITNKKISPFEGIYVMEITAHLDQITKYLLKISNQISVI